MQSNKFYLGHMKLNVLTVTVKSLSNPEKAFVQSATTKLILT